MESLTKFNLAVLDEIFYNTSNSLEVRIYANDCWWSIFNDLPTIPDLN